jgi:hypothetical protein
MIYINFKKGQGLGNQLWLYATGTSLAKKINKGLIILNYENFIGKSFIKLKYFKSNKKKFEHIFYERFYYDHNIKFINHFFDERILNIQKNTLIDGYFQDERYFFNKIVNLKNYITFINQKKLDQIILDNKTCVLNIRGGEYKRHKDFILPKNYWLNSMRLIRKKGIKKFIIVTDDENYCKRFLPGYQIISNSIEDCFMYLYKAKNIVVSNSSFSYFPILLQDTLPFVIAPSYWARHTSGFKRWASVSNYYPNWNWIDLNGKLMKKKKIIQSIKKTEEMYKINYNLVSQLKNFDHQGMRKYIPQILRNFIKKILSFVFPIKFG